MTLKDTLINSGRCQYMKYKAVIFDLDGTLLDSLEDLACSTNLALQRFGFPSHEIEKYKYFVGDGVYTLLSRTIPPESGDKAILQACVAAMKEEYGKRWDHKTRPYGGISELLEKLDEKCLKKAVLSNKPQEFTKLIIEKFFVANSFQSVLGERKEIPKKPDPIGALETARILEVKPAECLYLGDTDVDMLTAKRAGMFGIGVLWGFREKDELLANGAQALIEHPLDLLSFLD